VILEAQAYKKSEHFLKRSVKRKAKSDFQKMAQGYTFGFNGQEKDNEVKGTGNSLDFGARIYDSRLGRFLSIDPLTSKSPNLTPYSFADNSPIAFVDKNGEKAYWYVISFNETTNKYEAKLVVVKDNWLLKILPGHQLVVKVPGRDWQNMGGWSKSKMQERLNEILQDPVGEVEEEVHNQEEQQEKWKERDEQIERDWAIGMGMWKQSKGQTNKASSSSTSVLSGMPAYAKKNSVAYAQWLKNKFEGGKPLTAAQADEVLRAAQKQGLTIGVPEIDPTHPTYNYLHVNIQKANGAAPNVHLPVPEGYTLSSDVISNRPPKK
jgi:RHS repeat-associated protein